MAEYTAEQYRSALVDVTKELSWRLMDGTALSEERTREIIKMAEFGTTAGYDYVQKQAHMIGVKTQIIRDKDEEITELTEKIAMMSEVIESKQEAIENQWDTIKRRDEEIQEIIEDREKAEAGPSWRDELAARVMVAAVADPNRHPCITIEEVAVVAYRWTDALIAEGRKGAGE